MQGNMQVKSASRISALNDLKNPPKKLYYKGKWDRNLFTKCVAVVGSRKITEYGRRVIEKLVPHLVQDRTTIVSGFMYGVDKEAHKECLRVGGRTIAILGWGIEWDGMDREDQKLLSEIEKNGLVISEWKDQKPTLWTFPTRNRIVASISQEIIVVEAAVKSGALITAAIAHRLGRKVWAVPGPITSGVSEGTNQLIAEGLAEMWLPQAQLRLTVQSPDNPILQLLANETLTASEIARKLERPIDEVGAELSVLVLSDELTEREGKYDVS